MMWENIVEPNRPQMTVWHMPIACWVPETKTLSEYVTLSAVKIVAQTYLIVILYVRWLSGFRRCGGGCCFSSSNSCCFVVVIVVVVVVNSFKCII